MQFMIVAYDGTDEGALNRRLAVRDSHIAGAIELKYKGNLIAGGAILDDAGRMIGSTTYVDFESRAELDAWLERDPYVTGDVWRDITITPIRLTV
ncbi:MAG: YciI family protein [Pseudohongiellaceae bacterium]